MLPLIRKLRRRLKRALNKPGIQGPRAPRRVLPPPDYNTLGRLLDQFGLPSDARVLDIGGSAFGGHESTSYLLDVFDRVDVILSKPEHEAEIRGRYGPRVTICPSECELAENAYDLVVISPVLGKIVETTLDAPWRAARLLKPRGWLLTFGIDPEALGAPEFAPPKADVEEAFHKAFHVEGGAVRRLPALVEDSFELVANVRRKPAMRSYVTWLAMRLRQGAPAGTTVPAAIRLAEGGAFRSILRGLASDAAAPAVTAALQQQDVDTLMVVDNPLISDGRVSKTLETVRDLGRKVLGVGLGPDPEPVLTATRAGVPVLLFPNPRAELDRRLRIVHGPLTPAIRHELKMAILAADLEMLIQQLGERELIVHSHDFQALFAVGEALRNRLDGRVRWLHDVHEFIADYGIIDETVQRIGSDWEQAFIRLPHKLTGVSEEQCQRLAQRYGIEPPTVLYNAPRLANRHRYRGPSLRETLRIDGGSVLVHSGSVRPGRGVDHVIRVLPQIPDAHLVLLTQSAGTYLDTLLAEAGSAGVADRVHVLPAVPSEEVTGLLAGADAGLIPMDSYGNSEMSLPNKFFDYVFAGLPVLSSDTGSLTRLMTEWPVGELFARGDEASLARALSALLANRERYSRQICGRPDLLYRFAWEQQAVSLMHIYDELQQPSVPPPSPSRSRKAPKATAPRSGRARPRTSRQVPT